MKELEIVREKIQNKYRVMKTDEDLEWNRAIDLCTNIINAHIKHMNDGWIPVEERLPEGQTRVICQFDNGDIELLWQDWESDPETLTYLADFSMMAEKKVIAWRPLPDPYLPEKDN